LPGVGGIEPLIGSVVLTGPTTGEIGWQVHAVDPSHFCVSFRENLTINLSTLSMTGGFRNDAGVEGTNTLTPSACPSPAEVLAPGTDLHGPDTAR